MKIYGLLLFQFGFCSCLWNMQACEKAQACLQTNDVSDPELDESFERHAEKIKLLKYRAVTLAASHSGMP